jgi:hypothetical protein
MWSRSGDHERILVMQSTRHGSGAHQQALAETMSGLLFEGRRQRRRRIGHARPQRHMRARPVVQIDNATPMLPSRGWFFTRGIRGTVAQCSSSAQLQRVRTRAIAGCVTPPTIVVHLTFRNGCCACLCPWSARLAANPLPEADSAQRTHVMRDAGSSAPSGSLGPTRLASGSSFLSPCVRYPTDDSLDTA